MNYFDGIAPMTLSGYSAVAVLEAHTNHPGLQICSAYLFNGNISVTVYSVNASTETITFTVLYKPN